MCSSATDQSYYRLHGFFFVTVEFFCGAGAGTGQVGAYFWKQFVVAIFWITLGPNLFCEGAVVSTSYISDCESAAQLSGEKDCYWRERTVLSYMQSSDALTFATCTGANVAEHPEEDWFLQCHESITPNFSNYITTLGVIFATVQLLTLLVMGFGKLGQLVYTAFMRDTFFKAGGNDPKSTADVAHDKVIPSAWPQALTQPIPSADSRVCTETVRWRDL